MKIKRVYNKEMFIGFFMKLQKEYENDLYISFTDSRVNGEMDDLLKKKVEMLCLKGKDGIIGYCVFKDMKDGNVSIRNFFICNEFRGMGYGKYFLKLVLNLFHNMGLKKVVLASRLGKEGFYYSCGFAGKGLLQVDVEKATKQELEMFLYKHNINIEKYKLWQNEIHQFGFDANEIINNTRFMEDCNQHKYSAQVYFTKDITKTFEDAVYTN